MILPKSRMILLVILFSLPLCSPGWAGWQFALCGDSRDDYRRHQVFPEMIRDLNQTSYKIKDRELRPEFLLHLGDFEFRRGSRESLERFKAHLNGLKIRYYPAKGNHELVEPKGASFALPSIHQVLRDNQDFMKEYLSLFNLKESYYSFDHRDLHVIVLDNSFGTFQVNPDEELRSPQLLWLEKDLEETARKVQARSIRHTILCSHFPLPAPSEEVTTHDMLEYTARYYAEGKALAEQSAKFFWEILDRYREKSRIARLFFGHDRRYVSYRQRGFPVTITAGAGAPLTGEERGGFYHYVVVTVTDPWLKERIIKLYPVKKNP